MSNLYTTCGGDGRAQERTRCAHHYAWASVQSWEGSVTVEFEQPAGKDGEIYVFIYVADGSGTLGRCIFDCTLKELRTMDRLNGIVE